MHHRPFLAFLLAQIALIVFYPYVPIMAFRVLATLVFVTAVYVVGQQSRHWLIGLALGVPGVVLTAIAKVRSDMSLRILALSLTLAFLIFTVVVLFKAVIKVQEVTTETIYGAMSVYLLIAITWSVAYLLLSYLRPGAFVSSIQSGSNPLTWPDYLFFSFATLTATGYGDIIPRIAQARSLAILESVTGMMYVAVFVARLVGVYQRERPQRPGPPDGGDSVIDVGIRPSMDLDGNLQSFASRLAPELIGADEPRCPSSSSPQL